MFRYMAVSCIALIRHHKWLGCYGNGYHCKFDGSVCATVIGGFYAKCFFRIETRSHPEVFSGIYHIIVIWDRNVLK